ncbi:hypothetical protein Areg01_70660 [Actinoplanes regularis]|nr:hypothetical protein Areg01_70660 [Actinoplanes regularis]
MRVCPPAAAQSAKLTHGGPPGDDRKRQAYTRWTARQRPRAPTSHTVGHPAAAESANLARARGQFKTGRRRMKRTSDRNEGRMPACTRVSPSS